MGGFCSNDTGRYHEDFYYCLKRCNQNPTLITDPHRGGICSTNTGSYHEVKNEFNFFFNFLKDENKIPLTQRIRTGAGFASPVDIINIVINCNR